MDNQINNTRFQVYDEYHFCIDKEIKCESKFISTIKKSHPSLLSATFVASPLSPSGKGRGFSYDPLLEAEGLFTDLIKLPTIWDDNLNWNKEYKMNSLTIFLKNYGLPLGDYSFHERFEWRGAPLMNFYEFNRELYEYQKIFNIWASIKQNNATEIKRYAEEYHSKYKVHHRWVNTPRNEMEIAFYLLTVSLNKKSKGNSTFVISNGIPKKVYTFNDLFEVAYFQLSNFIELNGNFRTCKNCGHLFHKTHKSRVFCHNSPKNNISPCANSYKQRVQRDKTKARKLAKEGVDAREILKNINLRRDIYSKRTMNEILKWTK